MKIENTRNTFILLFTLVVIWSIILINIISFITSNHPNKITNTTNNNSLSMNKFLLKGQEEQTIYTIIERDPFHLPIHKIKHRKKTPQSIQNKNAKSETPQIKYIIKGIIIDGNTKRLLVMEDITNNKTVFLKQGEQYKGIKIDSILSEQLILTEDSSAKKYTYSTIKLNRIE